jgi:hypothetical protein
MNSLVKGAEMSLERENTADLLYQGRFGPGRLMRVMKTRSEAADHADLRRLLLCLIRVYLRNLRPTSGYSVCAYGYSAGSSIVNAAPPTAGESTVIVPL